MYILSHWSIKDRESSRGAVHVALVGKVFGHPRFAPGEVITTSAVTRYRFDTDSVVTHTGSEYRLGKPDATEPLAKQHLLLLLAPGGGEQSANSSTPPRDGDQTRMLA
jgi:hypothetical protein